jgi:hypothetical protein
MAKTYTNRSQRDELQGRIVLLRAAPAALAVFKVVLSHSPRSDHTRSVEAKQLDEGIGDTFVQLF